MDRYRIEACKCPACGKWPKKWIEPPKYRSSEIFYLACPKDVEIMGQGKSQAIAVFNWNRSVRRWQEEHNRPKRWTWLGLIENRNIDEDTI